MNRSAFYVAGLLYIVGILAANLLTQHYGLIAVGPLTVAAGTFAAGFVLLWRNITQDAVGRLAVVALMLIGIVLSWVLASPELAIASFVAFAVSETTDMAIYSPLRERGRNRAALIASAVSSVVDSFLFLWIAKFPIWPALAGQIIVKIAVCGLTLAVVGGVRAVFRHPVRAEGA